MINWPHTEGKQAVIESKEGRHILITQWVIHYVPKKSLIYTLLT